MAKIFVLEILFIDPEYFLEEHFLPIINKIDIKTEEAKIKTPEDKDQLNEEREKHLKKLQNHWDKCKLMIKEEIFKTETDKIKVFLEAFDSKSENSQEKLEENIKEMKSILLGFHKYYFDDLEENCEYCYDSDPQKRVKLGIVETQVNKFVKNFLVNIFNNHFY